MPNTIYDDHLDRHAANFQPLTPLSLMERAATVFAEYPCVVHGDIRRSWAETYARCRRLGSALAARGIGRGDTVAWLAANTPETFEAHYGIPMAGAVLNALNFRLDAEALAFILDHGEAKMLFVDPEFRGLAKETLAKLGRDIPVIDVDDPVFGPAESIGEMTYEAFLATGDPDWNWLWPEDEWDAIALNYTSGTTGNPKGVVYHHRGAFLNAVCNVVSWDMDKHAKYLWTLPMFHCNGWCYPWTMAAVAGVNVCLRQVRVEPIFEAFRKEKVTHFCGAPIVLSTIANAPKALREGVDHVVKVCVAAAPPPAPVIQAMKDMGAEVTHVYGLTESYGPAVVCEWKPAWNDLAPDQIKDKSIRQGVRYPMLEDLMVADPVTMQPVPRDAETMGEVMMRGNIIMKGYLKNPDATEEAFEGGWFHTGDMGVWHPDGYIQLKDRSKDVIISGGENISSLEVEEVIYTHPDVAECAVVAKHDDKWGETPCAFVTLKDGSDISEMEIIEYCRSKMARYKCPRTVVFGVLAKTSTGKVQKFKLREIADQTPQTVGS